MHLLSLFTSHLSPFTFHFSLFTLTMVGIFDSGFGGLTCLRSIREQLPEYDYLYLGDNARAPYGTRSFEVVYEYTWQAVQYLHKQGCRLIILACNTASAKALRTIQQRFIPLSSPYRVLGVIRPTVEAIGRYTKNNHIGVLATEGTVASCSYPIEIHKLYPEVRLTQQACPMWVPLIENGEHTSAGADYFVKKYLDSIFSQDPEIDTLLLGCTHYPLLEEKIRQYIPSGVHLLMQGEIVAHSLQDYLLRHPDIEQSCSKTGQCRFLTTESPERFSSAASLFLGEQITAASIKLD